MDHAGLQQTPDEVTNNEFHVSFWFQYSITNMIIFMVNITSKHIQKCLTTILMEYSTTNNLSQCGVQSRKETM